MPLADFYAEFPLLCHRLEQAKAHGRTGQAYLLMGDDAEFLLSFAKAWAMTAACQTPSPDGRACTTCKTCSWFLRDGYPEMRIIRPQSKSRTITVDAMRDFEHWIGLAATPGFLKVGIIMEAECLGDEAQNAFLKTLEEPPPDTMLLLLTVNARKLLPTIRSRCQTLSLLRNRADLSTALKKDLFATLKPLRRQAGAVIGLQTSAKIHQLFSELHKDAEAMADDLRDKRWDAVDDPKLKKQLEDDLLARIEAEYVRMRESLLCAIQAWYLQRLLISSGVRRELLPLQELLPFSDDVFANPPSQEEADHDIALAEELASCIRGNVDERLALDSFCLNVSVKG